MNKYSFILGLTLISCQFLGNDYDKMLQGLYSNTVATISTDSLEAFMGSNDSLMLLDTRSEEEYKVSHINGARWVGYDEFDIDSVADISKEKTIIVYCSVGYRSEKIGEKLQRDGFLRVYNLYGGIFQWVNEGREIVDLNETSTQKIHPYSSLWAKWLKKGDKVYE